MGLKVGVIGTGKLGREHVRVLKRVPEVELVGCYDIVTEKSQSVAQTFDAEAFDTIEQLIEAVDAVSVVVPTSQHAEVSLAALGQGKNLFLEKPIAASIGEAEQIVKAANECGRVLQIGHIERFNRAIRQSVPFVQDPSFIEIHRLAPFTIRGIDVSVIMDLMIHDLDLLSLFKGAEPETVRAKGAAILTNGPDIVNARLEYADGCVANLTASRVSLEPMRKVRVFSTSGYVSCDLLTGKIKHVRKGNLFDSRVNKIKTLDIEELATFGQISLQDFIEIEETETKGEEPLYDELRSFCQTVTNGESPYVSGEDGLRALRLATRVQALVEGGGS